jgi:hypothetical protein
MRNAIGFILLLVGICSFKKDKGITFSQCVGVYKSGDSYYYDIDSNYSIHHIRIELLPDSTYMEIHDNYQCFDLIDLWGRWEVRGDSIVLNRMGDLNFENGKYVTGDTSFMFQDLKNSKKILPIQSPNSLIWVDESFPKGLRLSRE